MGRSSKVLSKWLGNHSKKIIKIIFGKNTTYPSDILYKETKIFDIRQMYFYYICINQFKLKNQSKKVNHDYCTRGKKDKYETNVARKTVGQRCFSYLAPRIHNILPTEIKVINSLNTLKKKCKNYICEIPRDFIHAQIDIKNNS